MKLNYDFKMNEHLPRIYPTSFLWKS